MTPELPLNERQMRQMREMVFELLSVNERIVVSALGKAAHPLSLTELKKCVPFHYRTLKRVVRRLEKKKVVFGFRDVIKVVELNPVLRDI